MKKTLLVTFIFAIFAIANAYSATLHKRMVTCPIDGTQFEFMEMGSGTQLGTMLDGKPYGPIPAPYPMAKCPEDGFIIYKRSFTENELNILKKYVASKEYQEYQKSETNYWLINKLQEKLSVPVERRIYIMQRATWEADTWQYATYARETIVLLEEMQKPTPYDLFLKGELYRRVGDFRMAFEIFNTLDATYTKDDLFKKRIQQEIKLIVNNDSETYKSEK